MTTHCSIQIRDAVVTLVTSLSTTGARVFSGSPALYPLADNALPGLKVKLGSERLSGIELPRIYERRRIVYVIGCAKENDDLEGVLQQIGSEVEAVLGMAVGPWKTLVLEDIDPKEDVSAEKPAGELWLQYVATYYTRDGAPTVFL